MKPTKDSMIDPHELLAKAATLAAIKLLGVKVSFERLARLFSAVDAEGTYNGTDIYEVLRGVCEDASSALSRLVPPEREAEMRRIGMASDDMEFDRMIAGLEEGGHA